MKVILLAAGRGKRFGKRTKTWPKCLIPIGQKDEHLLSRYLNTFRLLGLTEVIVVVGHMRALVTQACRKHGPSLDIRFIHNPRYRLGSIVSLQCASKEFDDDILVMDADVYFDPAALKKILRTKRSTFLLDTRSRSMGEEMMLMSRGGQAVKIAKKVDPALKTIGEATGFFKVVKKDAVVLGRILNSMVRRGITGVEYEDAYNELMKKVTPATAKIDGFWSEMDFEEDLRTIKAHHKRTTTRKPLRAGTSR